MSGNAWEWTRSLYENYPYQPHDGREKLNVSKEGARVLRGGSFVNGPGSLRCGFRVNLGPDVRDVSVGFRVVSAGASAG
jgi:formylglycine-generating enzyme required for sulfatase activity